MPGRPDDLPPTSPRRPRRHPTFAEQLRPTIDLVRSSIRARDEQSAIRWIDYADYEWVGSNFDFYTQWHAGALAFLRERGIAEDDLEGAQADLALLVNEGWQPGVAYDRGAEWRRYRALKARLVRELNAPVDVALATLDAWKELWRSIHDRDVDYASGLMNVARQRLGESALEDLLRHSIVDRFDFRYARYDVSRVSWEQAFEDLVHASIETQRGHLVGPGREGVIELTEHPDRVVISFEPCGTGGRTVAGDHLSGTPSRHRAPYYLHAIEARHDFAWNKPGVCQYCSHCAMMTGKLPIERFGYPLRVVDPPLAGHPTGRCTWTLYRNPRDVPASYYESLGEKKPGPDEALGSASRRPMSA